MKMFFLYASFLCMVDSATFLLSFSLCTTFYFPALIYGQLWILKWYARNINSNWENWQTIVFGKFRPSLKILPGQLLTSAKTRETICVSQKYAIKEKMRVVKGQVFS